MKCCKKEEKKLLLSQLWTIEDCNRYPILNENVLKKQLKEMQLYTRHLSSSVFDNFITDY